MVNAEQCVTLNEPDVNLNCNSHHHKRICKVIQNKKRKKICEFNAKHIVPKSNDKMIHL